MTAWELLRSLHTVCHFQTREGSCVGPASASELKRWLQRSAIHINAEPVRWDEVLDFPLHSVILFPRGKRITLL